MGEDEIQYLYILQMARRPAILQMVLFLLVRLSWACKPHMSKPVALVLLRLAYGTGKSVFPCQQDSPTGKTTTSVGQNQDTSVFFLTREVVCYFMEQGSRF